jgi:hypothetical protein
MLSRELLEDLARMGFDVSKHKVDSSRRHDELKRTAAALDAAERGYLIRHGIGNVIRVR